MLSPSFPTLTFIKEPRVTRVRGTNPKATKEESVKMATSQEELSSDNLLIEFQNITRTWVPSKNGRDIGARVSDQILSMIGDLCNCRIERLDESRSDVTLRGDTEQDIEKALLKLRIADEAAVRRCVLYVQHLLIP